MYRPLTSRQRCGTALVLGMPAAPAAAEEAVDDAAGAYHGAKR